MQFCFIRGLVHSTNLSSQDQPDQKKMYQHLIIPEIVQEVLISDRKSFLSNCNDMFEVVHEEETSSALLVSVIALAATAVIFPIIILLASLLMPTIRFMQL